MEIILVILLILLAGLAGFNWTIFKRLKEPKENTEIQTLHQRMDTVTQIILNQLKENRESSERSSFAFNQQTQGFISGITQLQETVKNVQESVKGVVSFQNIFKSPKLRGQWGETSLEAVLSQYFPKEVFSIQHYSVNVLKLLLCFYLYFLELLDQHNTFYNHNSIYL